MPSPFLVSPADEETLDVAKRHVVDTDKCTHLRPYHIINISQIIEVIKKQYLNKVYTVFLASLKQRIVMNRLV